MNELFRELGRQRLSALQRLTSWKRSLRISQKNTMS